jgi:hypothetical protein
MECKYGSTIIDFGTNMEVNAQLYVPTTFTRYPLDCLARGLDVAANRRIPGQRGPQLSHYSN